MRLRCPACNQEIDSTALRIEWGTGGAYHCPLCNELVRISLPYRLHVAVISTLIAVAVLIVLKVRNPAAFLFLTALIWVPVSLILNAASSRIKPPTLKKQRQQRSPYDDHTYQIVQENYQGTQTPSTPTAVKQEPDQAKPEVKE